MPRLKNISGAAPLHDVRAADPPASWQFQSRRKVSRDRAPEKHRGPADGVDVRIHEMLRSHARHEKNDGDRDEGKGSEQGTENPESIRESAERRTGEPGRDGDVP